MPRLRTPLRRGHGPPVDAVSLVDVLLMACVAPLSVALALVVRQLRAHGLLALALQRRSQELGRRAHDLEAAHRALLERLVVRGVLTRSEVPTSAAASSPAPSPLAGPADDLLAGVDDAEALRQRLVAPPNNSKH